MLFKSSVPWRLHKKPYVKPKHKRNKWPLLRQTDKPAGKLDELYFILAFQQRLSVLQQDGSTDEELKGEVSVDGLQL